MCVCSGYMWLVSVLCDVCVYRYVCDKYVYGVYMCGVGCIWCVYVCVACIGVCRVL